MVPEPLVILIRKTITILSPKSPLNHLTILIRKIITILSPQIVSDPLTILIRKIITKNLPLRPFLKMPKIGPIPKNTLRASLKAKPMQQKSLLFSRQRERRLLSSKAILVKKEKTQKTLSPLKTTEVATLTPENLSVHAKRIRNILQIEN